MKKTALITGSSRGIGAATARALAEAGYAVCINYLEQREKAEALEALSQEILPMAGRNWLKSSAMALRGEVSKNAGH